MKKNYISRILLFSLMIIGVAAYYLGIVFDNYIYIMASAYFIFISSIVFCSINVKRRFLLLIFDGLIFLFLMGRPLIALFTDINYFNRFSENSIVAAFTSLDLTLIFLLIGSFVYEKTHTLNCRFSSMSIPFDLKLSKIQVASLFLLVVTIVFKFILGAEKMIFMKGRTYMDFYNYFESSLPFFFASISFLFPFALCAYLATFPRKHETFCVLVLNVATTLPDLVIGIRNPFVVSVLFSFVYYCLRDFHGSRYKWIGRIEKLLIVCCFPLAILGLAAMNYTRDGGPVPTSEILILFRDFLFKQGVSFEVLCDSFEVIPSVLEKFKGYTLGGVLDTVLYGGISQMLFGASALPNHNSVIKALQGHSFADFFSYITWGDYYLAGHGRGSCYISEIFADFSWGGIIIINLLLGCLLCFFADSFKGGYLRSFFSLVCIMNLFLLPRGMFSAFWSYFFNIHVWLVLIAVFVLAWLLPYRLVTNKRRKSIRC